MPAAPAPAATPAPVAPPAPPTSLTGNVIITLTNGDTFHATIVSDADPMVIEHALIGRMSIARERVKDIQKEPPPATPAPGVPPAAPLANPPTPAPAPAPTSAQPEIKYAAPAIAPPPPVAAAAAPQLPAAPKPEPGLLDLWKFTVETGLNGTAGKTPIQSFRGLINATRNTPEMVSTAALGWWYTRSDDTETQQRVQADGRTEWPVTAKSSLSYYVAGRSEYDQFQQWDWRLSGQAGLSLTLWKDETLTLTGRSGFGASREFGSPTPDVHAEFSPSLDLELRINPRNKFCASASANLDMEHTDGSRADLKAWYEAVLDPDHGMSLKLGVEDRYEHSPASFREKHEVDYFAVIVFSF